MNTTSESAQKTNDLERVVDNMMTASILNSNERFSEELQYFLYKARKKDIDQIQASEIMLLRMATHINNLPNGVSVATFEAKQKLVRNLQQVMLQ